MTLVKMGNYNLCIRKRGRSIPLSYNFGSKSEADKSAKEKNKNLIRFTIGGRGFKSKRDAIDWKTSVLEHPPLGYSKEEYNKVLNIIPKPKSDSYKIEVCKK